MDLASIMPSIIAQSTCEAEYNTASLCGMAGFYIRKIWNELLGRDTDAPLTIPMGIDSQSAIDTAKSAKETQRTRHIARRYHFIRFAVASSDIALFKVSGLANCAKSLTKSLNAEQLKVETNVYEVDVDP